MAHSLIAERAVLACVFIDPHLAAGVELAPGDFFLPRNRVLWQGVLDCIEADVLPDPCLLAARLERGGMLDEAGGLEYIAGLSESMACTYQLPQFVEIVRDCARDWQHEQDGLAGIVDVADPMPQLAGRIKSFYGQGIRSHVPFLDDFLGGFRESEVTLVLGETGRGKTTLGIVLADEIALQGVPCLYVASEPRNEQVQADLIQRHAGDFCDKFPPEELQRIRDEVVAKLPLKIWPINQDRAAPVLAFREIVKGIRTQAQRGKAKFVVLDNLHHAMGDDPRPAEVGAAIRSLVGLSEEEKIHIVVLAHVGQQRGRRGGAMGLHDFKGPHAAAEQVPNALGIEPHKNTAGEWETLLHCFKRRSKVQGLPLGTYTLSFDVRRLAYGRA